MGIRDLAMAMGRQRAFRIILLLNAVGFGIVVAYFALFPYYGNERVEFISHGDPFLLVPGWAALVIKVWFVILALQFAVGVHALRPCPSSKRRREG